MHKIHCLSLSLVFLLTLPVNAHANFGFGCSDHSQREPIDWGYREKKSNEKPSDLTPEEIAQAAVISSIFPQKIPDYATAVISKMDAPLRILLQHGNGDDLDLSTSPGKEIEAYFKRLSHDIGIPITLTTRDKKDNNVSIVLARAPVKDFDCDNWNEPVIGWDKIDFMTTQTGAIMGVPELDAKTRTLESAKHELVNRYGKWHTLIYTIGGVGGHEVPTFHSRYMMEERIGACLIFIDINVNGNKIEDFVLSIIDDYIKDCARLSNSTAFMLRKTDRIKERKLSNAYNGHERYFWRLLAPIKSGMSAPEAEKIILQQIQTQQ
jgi:hypothetical protein